MKNLIKDKSPKNSRNDSFIFIFKIVHEDWEELRRGGMLHQSLLLEYRRAQKGTAAEECASKKCSGNHGLGLFLSYPLYSSFL